MLISSMEVKVTEERGARWRSEDMRTRRELGVDWRLGKSVRARRNCERWLTWK